MQYGNIADVKHALDVFKVMWGYSIDYVQFERARHKTLSRTVVAGLSKANGGMGSGFSAVEGRESNLCIFWSPYNLQVRQNGILKC